MNTTLIIISYKSPPYSTSYSSKNLNNILNINIINVIKNNFYFVLLSDSFYFYCVGVNFVVTISDVVFDYALVKSFVVIGHFSLVNVYYHFCVNNGCSYLRHQVSDYFSVVDSLVHSFVYLVVSSVVSYCYHSCRLEVCYVYLQYLDLY